MGSSMPAGTWVEAPPPLPIVSTAVVCGAAGHAAAGHAGDGDGDGDGEPGCIIAAAGAAAAAGLSSLSSSSGCIVVGAAVVGLPPAGQEPERAAVGMSHVSNLWV
jgi:hypothetical protein